MSYTSKFFVLWRCRHVVEDFNSFQSNRTLSYQAVVHSSFGNLSLCLTEFLTVIVDGYLMQKVYFTNGTAQERHAIQVNEVKNSPSILKIFRYNVQVS